MRVSNSGFTNTIKYNLTSQSDRIGTLYGQLSSGKRLQQLSDDPTAMVRALRAHASLDELTARQTVAQQGAELVGATDTALGDVANALSQAKDLALQADTATVDASSRAALADQIRSLQTTLVTTGNTEVQGHYLFSGTQTQTAPLEASDTANLPVLYNGDHQALSYQVGDEKIGVGFTGAQVFNYPNADGTRPVATASGDMFSVLNDLANAVAQGDSGQIESLGKQVDDLHSYAVNLRAQNGIVAQRWQNVQSKATDTATLLNQVISDNESVDYTSALVELSNLQTAYQAALSLTSRMLQLPTLFDQS